MPDSRPARPLAVGLCRATGALLPRGGDREFIHRRMRLVVMYRRSPQQLQAAPHTPQIRGRKLRWGRRDQLAVAIAGPSSSRARAASARAELSSSTTQSGIVPRSTSHSKRVSGSQVLPLPAFERQRFPRVGRQGVKVGRGGDATVHLNLTLGAYSLSILHLRIAEPSDNC